MNLYWSGKRKKIIFIVTLGVLFILGTIFLVIFLNNRSARKSYLEELETLKTEVYQSLPSEVSEDFNFTYQFENYPEAIVVYKSLNETIISSAGKVSKQEEETLVWIEAEIIYRGEVLFVRRDVRVKPYNAQEMQIVLAGEVAIPSRDYQGIILPTYLGKYNCTITYLPFAQRMENGAYVDEESIRILLTDSGAIIEADTTPEEIRCFIVAIFEYNGNTFRKNYPVYTVSSSN